MSEWEPTPLEQQRLAKLAKLKDAGVDPYPIGSKRTHSTREVLNLFLAQEEFDAMVARIPEEGQFG